MTSKERRVPLQISVYRDIVSARNGPAQMPDGPPVYVSVNNFTGAYTIPEGGRLVRLKGTGTIQWSGDQTAEDVSGTEWRGVRAGDDFTIG